MGGFAGSPEAIVQIACLDSDVSAMNAAEMLSFGGFVRTERFGAVEKVHLYITTAVFLSEGPDKKEQQ